jgi:hypothetical protein
MPSRQNLQKLGTCDSKSMLLEWKAKEMRENVAAGTTRRTGCRSTTCAAARCETGGSRRMCRRKRDLQIIPTNLDTFWCKNLARHQACLWRSVRRRMSYLLRAYNLAHSSPRCEGFSPPTTQRLFTSPIRSRPCPGRLFYAPIFRPLSAIDVSPAAGRTYQRFLASKPSLTTCKAV